MLDFLKNYYVFMLILMVLSYLVPKEEYKVYIHFFIGIFVIVLLLEPILELLTLKDPTLIYKVFEELNKKIEEVSFEYFIFEGKGE